MVPWVVPVAMKLIAPHGERCQCFVADPDCRGVSILILRCRSEDLGRGYGKECQPQGPASTVGCNMAGPGDSSFLCHLGIATVGSSRPASSTPLERTHEADAPAVSTWPWALTAAPTAMSERIASAPRQGKLRRAAPALDSAPRQAPVDVSLPSPQLS